MEMGQLQTEGNINQKIYSGWSSVFTSYFSKVKNVVKKEGHLPITKLTKQLIENTKISEDF